MPLSLAALEAIQAEQMADDVEIDLKLMSLWSSADAERYFGSGGVDLPEAVQPPAAPSREPLGRKVRIACLHGSAGCEKIFRIQLYALLKALKDDAEFFFIDGHRTIEPGNTQAATIRQFYGDDLPLMEYGRPRLDDRDWRTYLGLDDGIAAIEKALCSIPGGGADVLLGFSQGANFGTMVASRAARGGAGAAAPFRCLVLLSPTLPGWVRQKPELFEAPLGTPALVTWSEDDDVVKSGPTEVASLFTDARTRVHLGPGHRPLPAKKEELAMLAGEIRAFVLEQCPA
jgi:predicted esterase